MAFNLICQMCRQSFIGTKGNVKFCNDCRWAAKLERDRNNRMKKK